MRTGRLKILEVMLLMLAVSCDTKRADFAEAGDEQLKVQGLKIRKKESPGLVDYQVRVQVINPEIGNEQLAASMMYKMDSAFYLANGAVRVYPEILEPVASGIKNRFEYMVSFKDVKAGKDDKALLVYADKFISRKAYTLEFK